MSKETISAVNVKTLTTTALLAAVLCILGPLSIPIGPVPISLTSLALYFMVFLVGPKMSAAACAIYILIGFAGLPVFSGFTGGPQKLAGPTGGYIIGFLPMIMIIGLIAEKAPKNLIIRILAGVIGTVVLYAMGTAWLAQGTGMTFGAALGVGVIPFAGLDFLKICAAAMIAPLIRGRLIKAGLLKA